MTNTTLPPPSPTLTESLVRLTTDQYHQMLDSGIIPEDSSTELLNGLMITKNRSDGNDTMTHGEAHRHAVRLLTKLAAKIDSDANHFQIQLPIHLSEFDEPEPDGAVIIGPDARFADNLPTAADVAAVIEVSKSSLDFDVRDKLSSYAAAAIPQYIIINLRSDCIDVYTDPTAATYRSKRTIPVGQSFHLNLGNARSLEVNAADLLP